MRIPDAKVEEAASAVHKLFTSITDLIDAFEQDSDEAMIALDQERERCTQCLEDATIFHKQIPIALGSGRAGVEYKLKGLVRNTFPEAQAAGRVSNVFKRFRGACVDLGENTMPDVSGLRVVFKMLLRRI